MSNESTRINLSRFHLMIKVNFGQTILHQNTAFLIRKTILHLLEPWFHLNNNCNPNLNLSNHQSTHHLYFRQGFSFNPGQSQRYSKPYYNEKQGHRKNSQHSTPEGNFNLKGEFSATNFLIIFLLSVISKIFFYKNDASEKYKFLTCTGTGFQFPNRFLENVISLSVRSSTPQTHTKFIFTTCTVGRTLSFRLLGTLYFGHSQWRL